MATVLNEKDTIAVLDEFMERWNAYDVDGILEMFTEDVVFQTSSGQEPTGRQFLGREAAREGIERVIKALPEYEFTDITAWVKGDHAVAEWTMSHTVDGERVAVRGCDLFELRGDKISRKDSYRKHIPGAEYKERTA
jgi:ketosteroid isomerase-like protein